MLVGPTVQIIITHNFRGACVVLEIFVSFWYAVSHMDCNFGDGWNYVKYCVLKRTMFIFTKFSFVRGEQPVCIAFIYHLCQFLPCWLNFGEYQVHSKCTASNYILPLILKFSPFWKSVNFVRYPFNRLIIDYYTLFSFLSFCNTAQLDFQRSTCKENFQFG